jgi:hypothetical protein
MFKFEILFCTHRTSAQPTSSMTWFPAHGLDSGQIGRGAVAAPRFPRARRRELLSIAYSDLFPTCRAGDLPDPRKWAGPLTVSCKFLFHSPALTCFFFVSVSFFQNLNKNINSNKFENCNKKSDS